jgi:hypothetical protein
MYYTLTSSISNGLLALYGSDERIININININVGNYKCYEGTAEETCEIKRTRLTMLLLIFTEILELLFEYVGLNVQIAVVVAGHLDLCYGITDNKTVVP